MPTKLNLRLRAEDRRALEAAAEIIAGPAGAPHVRRITIIRRALAAFNAQHRDAPVKEPAA